MWPIILAHGIARFDAVRDRIDRIDKEPSASDRLHYFRRIKSTLLKQPGWAGLKIFHTSVGFTDGVGVREAELRTQIAAILKKSGAKKVHIIAHSMGGLDARHMMFDDSESQSRDAFWPIHTRVASLTTIGTPHLGTSFADWGVEQASVMLKFLDAIEVRDLDGFRDLTTAACTAFNGAARNFEDTNGVVYQTIAGAQDLASVFLPLRVSWSLINLIEGPNDGLVSLASARWREGDPRVKNWDNIDADHLNQIGWSDVGDLDLSSPTRIEARIRELYVTIVRSLS